MANTFTLKTSSYDGRYLQLSCTQTTDISKNTSTISWTLTVAGGNSSYYTTGPTSVKINNKEVYSKARVSWSTNSFPAAKGSTSGSLTVTHNNDGSLTIPVSLSTAIYDTTTRSKSGNWELDKIPRGASITSAPNFNDEANPVLKYSNPAGNTVTTLEACIANSDGTTVYVPYRDISKTDTSYTFMLTDAERNTLRNATPNSNTMTVRFYVRTKIGDNTFRNSVTKNLTIKNPEPKLNPTVVDTGSNSTTYTGDPNNKVIKGYNTMSITFGTSAVKGATIKSQKVTCGAKSRTTDGTMANVESGDFVFTITDSRGNTTTKTIKKTLINYYYPTVNITSLNLSTEGVLTANISGKVWIGNFGATENTYSLRYRYKTSGGEWGSWATISMTPGSSGSFTASKTISGLDYKTSYVFQAAIRDTLSPYDSNSIKTPEKAVSSYPIFDWSAEDFNFNVPVFFQGQQMVDFIIEQGTEAMGSNGTWYWEKWASGKAVCYGRRNFGAMAVTTAWGSLYQSESFTQALPSGLFASTPLSINIEFNDANYGGWIARDGASSPSTTSSGSFRVLRASSATLSRSWITFNITGRWK